MPVTTTPPNAITVRYADGVASVFVYGELDVATSADLRARLLEAIPVTRTIVVDLAELGFIDSTGIGVLVGAAKRLAAEGGEIRLRGVRPKTMRVFEVTGVDRIVDIEPAPAAE